ncbi:hypothetical protein EBU71_14460 [bacterium]|nr:hypothetical protein [Candidatus Elulimicrobium humile]
MAHFVKLENGIVVQGIVVNNAELLDENGVESEAKGIAFCSNLLGGTWKQTSYNARIRKNYAGIGYTYDETLDAFIPPKPFDSWLLDENKAQWKAPVDYPTDEGCYTWNEETKSWDAMPESA